MIGSTWLSYVGYACTLIPMLYFYNHFLKPKYTRLKTSILFVLLGLVWAWIVTKFFYLEAAMKPFASILGMYVWLFVLYKETIYKMIIAPIIVVIIAIIGEAPVDYIMVFVLEMNLSEIVQSPYFFFLQIAVVVMSFIITVYVIKLLEQGKMLFKKHGTIIVVMSVQFLVTVTCVSQLLLMEGIQTSKAERIQYIFIMFVVSIIAYGVMLYMLQRLYARTKLEISMQKLKSLYEEQLKDYDEQDVNEEMLRYLRHDLTNYILNKQHKGH